LHGGGYRLGSSDRSTPFATRLARAAASIVVVVDYRLAPEHPFPACLHDAARVYEAAMEDSDTTVVVGDSAGGGLAASLVVAAAMSGVPLPAGLVLLSPWLDLTCAAGTYATRAESDQLFSVASGHQLAALYLQGHDPCDPLASPAFATLDSSWPQTLVMASTDEVLLQDSLDFTTALALAGVRVTAIFEPERPHVWPIFLHLPASGPALETIGSFYHHIK
jgi:acetyl esterase/lipase